MGSDETGKGDYFGPLIVCGFYLDKKDKDSVYISAKKAINIELLKKLISINVKKTHYMIYPNFLKNETY